MNQVEYEFRVRVKGMKSDFGAGPGIVACGVMTYNIEDDDVQNDVEFLEQVFRDADFFRGKIVDVHIVPIDMEKV